MADKNEGAQLERDAVALVKKYGLMLPKPAKDFFRRLAAHLRWTELMGALK